MKTININGIVNQTSSCAAHTRHGFENYVAETLTRLGTDRLQATHEVHPDGTVVLKYIWPGTKTEIKGLNVFNREIQ